MHNLRAKRAQDQAMWLSLLLTLLAGTPGTEERRRVRRLATTLVETPGALVGLVARVRKNPRTRMT